MKKIRLVALIAAVVTALGLFFFLKSLNKPATVAKATVIVAASNISQNTTITQTMIKKVSLPAESVLSGAVTNESQVVGKVVNTDLVAGEQIVGSQLVKAGEVGSSTLAYAVKAGDRAITVGVDDVSGLDGMIKPGNAVDIIAQNKVAQGSTTVPGATLLLQNITVLAVDQVLTKDGVAQGKTYKTVTLDVTPNQAVQLSYYVSTGTIRMILRSPLDQSQVSVPNVTQ